MTSAVNVESTNWSGAVITAASGSFSTVSAEWVVPYVEQVPIKGTSLSAVAEWVGIDGFNSSDVCQAGVIETVQTSANGKTTISCSAFDEWYPAASNTLPFQVNQGDTIKVTVVTSGAGATTASFCFDDITTGVKQTFTLTAPHGTSLNGNSAEVVVETPEFISGRGQVLQPFLSDFLGTSAGGNIVFQDVSATYANGSAASFASAQSIGVYTDDVPGSYGYYVQEAYGSIDSTTVAGVPETTVSVTEDDYWPTPSSQSSTLSGYDYYF